MVRSHQPRVSGSMAHVKNKGGGPGRLGGDEPRGRRTARRDRHRRCTSRSGAAPCRIRDARQRGDVGVAPCADARAATWSNAAEWVA